MKTSDEIIADLQNQVMFYKQALRETESMARTSIALAKAEVDGTFRAPLVLPTIHLNGTSQQSLLDDVCEAHRKLREAIEAFNQVKPNGRDYYPTGNLEPALEQYYEQRNRLVGVDRYLQNYGEGIADGGAKQ